MDKWSSLPPWGWMIVALLFGYAIGLVHIMYLHWFRGRAHCPRCLHYFTWRETLLRELIPDWSKRPHAKDPWERENPPASPSPGD